MFNERPSEGTTYTAPEALETRIRVMETGDVEDVVRVHMQAFHGFFLAFLGPIFLFHLYSGIIKDRSGIAFVGVRNGQVCGFVAGTDEQSGFYRRLLQKDWFRFGIASIPAVIRHPKALFRLARALQKPSEHVEPGTGILMSIAVSPAHQSEGLGKKLVLAFLQEARQRGLKSVTLTTDQVNNDAVNQFYQNLGFRISRAYDTPEGRRMNEYSYFLA